MILLTKNLNRFCNITSAKYMLKIRVCKVRIESVKNRIVVATGRRRMSPPVAFFTDLD